MKKAFFLSQKEVYPTTSIVLGREEVYPATSKVWSFHKVDDIVGGINVKLSNMAGGFPFTLDGVEWADSERLYLCGEYSHNTEEHKEIQEKIRKSTSGYAAKRFVKAANKKAVRTDFLEFRLEWMLYCVWAKCLGNADFRKLLLSIPDDVILLENTTTDNGGTAEIWGCRNKELVKARKEKEAELRRDFAHLSKKELELKVNLETNKIDNIGEWVGQNNIGKILMYCHYCLKTNTQPDINYDLLDKANIYIQGRKVPPLESRIEILNGNLLTSSPSIEPVVEKELSREERHELFNNFAENVPLFLKHRKEFYNDSRLFLTPAPIENGLAYTGAFKRACIGTYLEWWEHYPESRYTDDKGNEWKVLVISGSALTGCNSCVMVNESGETFAKGLPKFSGIYTSFLKVNGRYKEAIDFYEHYTLEETIEKLKNNR